MTEEDKKNIIELAEEVQHAADSGQIRMIAVIYLTSEGPAVRQMGVGSKSEGMIMLAALEMLKMENVKCMWEARDQDN